MDSTCYIIELAFTYDAVAWLVSLGQWQAWGRTALDRVRGPRVLEIGHGPGHLLIALARSGRRPIGIDLSPQMIRIAQRNIRQAGVNVPQVQCRVQALPFRSGEFDSVVSTFPSDYIADLATLREVQRVTNERGKTDRGVWGAADRARAEQSAHRMAVPAHGPA